MSRPPIAIGLQSPCCKLPMYQLPQGENALQHVRCSECWKLWALRDGELIPCVSPDEHLRLSGAASPLSPR